jgi:hypothetical protein
MTHRRYHKRSKTTYKDVHKYTSGTKKSNWLIDQNPNECKQAMTMQRSSETILETGLQTKIEPTGSAEKQFGQVSATEFTKSRSPSSGDTPAVARVYTERRIKIVLSIECSS